MTDCFLDVQEIPSNTNEKLKLLLNLELCHDYSYVPQLFYNFVKQMSLNLFEAISLKYETEVDGLYYFIKCTTHNRPSLHIGISNGKHSIFSMKIVDRKLQNIKKQILTNIFANYNGGKLLVYNGDHIDQRYTTNKLILFIKKQTNASVQQRRKRSRSRSFDSKAKIPRSIFAP